MTDPLESAVDASVAAHTPGTVPPFEAVHTRKRARDRRRGGAALALTVLVVGGAAVVPGVLTGGTTTGQVAQDAGRAERFGYYVRAVDPQAFLADPGAGPALDRCLALPGVSGGLVLQSLPAQYAGTITGREEADAFRACVDGVQGMGVTLTRRGEGAREYALRPRGARTTDDAARAQVGACLRLPGVTGSATQESDPPVYGVDVGTPEAATAFEDCMRRTSTYTTELAGSPASGDLTLAQMQALRERIGVDRAGLEARGVELSGWGPDAARGLVSVGVESDLAGATRVLQEEYGDDVYVTVAARSDVEAGGPSPGPGLVWTGVQVCRVEPERSCTDLGEEEAARLDAVLALETLRPAEAGVVDDCVVEPHDHTVRFQHPSALTVAVVVPDTCEPLRLGDQAGARVLEVGQAARDVVRLAHFRATTTGSHGDLTVAQQRFVERCVGGDLTAAGDVDSAVGRDADPASGARVLGRDGECLGRDGDRRDDRVNVVVEAGTVVWAGRF